MGASVLPLPRRVANSRIFSGTCQVVSRLKFYNVVELGTRGPKAARPDEGDWWQTVHAVALAMAALRREEEAEELPMRARAQTASSVRPSTMKGVEMSPRISVVIPVYGVRDFLPDCLESVLSDPTPEIEVIAVDDRSPDECGEILDAYASRDARLRVVHLDRNVGLGRSRDTGLAHARGTYVWFVDGDDKIAPGGLAAVLERLDRVRPDVLVTGFARLYPDGRIEPDVWRHLLTGEEPCTLADRPALLNTIMSAWNKVIRRDLLLAWGLRFGTGYYEDIAVTYPVLLAAQRIALLDTVCYLYRRGRAGSILESRSERHFDVFVEYERIFAFVGGRPEIGYDLTRAVFDRTVRHGLTICTTRGLVPDDRRREFFHRLSLHFRTHRPGGYRYPPGLRGLQYRLVAHDRYVLFAALQPVNRMRLAARRLPRRAAAGVGRLAYFLFTLLPIRRDLVVYAAYWYGDYACNPRAIYETALEIAPHLRGVWVIRPDRASRLPPGVEHVSPGTWRYLLTLARAGHLVNNVNFPLPKRRGAVHVQTQHGTPLKTMGTDLRDHPVAAAGMDFDRLARRCADWDYLLSPNPHTTEIWRRVYPGTYRILETGYPRDDILATATPGLTALAKKELGIDPGQTVVLFAPTHRDGQDGFVPQVDLEEFASSLGPEYTLIVRAHYFDRPGPVSVLDVSGHPRVEEVCLAADVLVSDYSSLLVDYAVLDRPIVVYAPDLDAYRATRGLYVDLLAEPPGAVATSQAELLQIFAERRHLAPEAVAARERFRARFCPHEDGRSAERAIREAITAVHPTS